MLVLAALALTGCIQSFAIGSSSTVGAGIELYNDPNNVAPYVNNFQIVEKQQDQIEYDDQGQPIIDPSTGKPQTKSITIYTLEPIVKANFLADRQTIKELKTKWGAPYGAYGNQSSTVRILDTKGQALVKPELGLTGSTPETGQLVRGDQSDQPLFMNNLVLEQLEAKSYQPQNQWRDLNFFVVKKPDTNEANLTPEQKKVWAKGISAIDAFGAFTPYERGSVTQKWTPVQIENGQYVTYDADGDGYNDSTQTVQIKNPARIAKFKFGFDAEVVTLSSDLTSYETSAEAYARDFIQTIANTTIQFAQVDPLLTKLQQIKANPTTGKVSTLDAGQRLGLLSKANLSKLFLPPPPDQSAIDETKLLSHQERAAVLAYQRELTGLLSRFGFGIKEQSYAAKASEWNEPYKVQFLPEKKREDIKTLVLGGAPVPQKTITNWAEAWGLGPFYGLVVWPLSFLMNGLVRAMPGLGGWDVIISIFVAVILSRIFVTLLSYKSIFSQHKQQMIAPKKAKIDAKYEPHKGNKQLEQRKRQEMAELYRKHNISMSAQLFGILVSSPIFLAMWRVVQGIVGIKSTTWLGIQFSAQSWKELFAGSWQYLPLMLIAILMQAAAQFLPKYLSKKRLAERVNVAEKAAMKKANKVQNIISVVFIFFPVIFEAGVQIYWIVGAIWQIAITLIVHWVVKTDFYKNKLSKYV